MEVSRRELLKLLLAGGAAAFAPPRLGHAHMAGGPIGGGGPSPLVVPFAVPLPRMPVAKPVRSDANTDYYDLTMRQADVEILPGTTTRVWGYDGMTPGPTFRVARGRRIVTCHRNRLPEAMSVHLHGGHVASRHDGHPTATIAPGNQRTYVYRNAQRPATLWYHDHVMDRTGPHVYSGLAGVYIIESAREAALGLPSGEYDIPVVIQDRSFSSDAALVYRGNLMGEMGDTILVNGAPYPYLRVGTRRIRLRLLNGSNARVYDLELSNGQPFVQIGTDGGLLAGPIALRSIVLAPGERADVVIDFGPIAVGSRVEMRNRLGSGSTAQVMRFDVTRREADNSRVPETLSRVKPLQAADASATRTFTFSRAMGMSAPWVINGQPYDPARIDARPRRGDVEIWRLRNHSMMDHPVHIHDIQWQILDVNGRQPAPAQQGWKDTFLLPALGSVRVIGRFTRFTGLYVFHCHNLEHEDYAMMAQFEVVA